MAALAAALPAAAAPALTSFNIPAQPLQEALVQFAVQASVSIGDVEARACGAVSRPVVGRFTPAEGLARLLSGGPCRFTMIDARTFRIERPAPPRPRPAPPPTPPTPPPVRTEAQGDEAANVVLDVVVTATKRPALAGSTPASLTILAGADLARAGIAGLSSAAPSFAGVTATNLGPGRNKLFVRGLSDGAFTGRTQATVGLYLNEAPITYNAPDPDLRLVDVEQIELLRGPQGSLYGVGSLGGVLRIVTRKPDLTTASGWVSATARATEDGAPGGVVEAMVNLPLTPDRLGLRAVAYREVDGGYIDDVRLGLNNVNRTVRNGGRATLALKIDPNWSLQLRGAYQALNSDDTQYANVPNTLERTNLVREPHDNDFAQGAASLEGEGRWGRLKLSSSYLSHGFDNRYDASVALPAFGSTAPAGAFDEANRVKLLVGEAIWTSPEDKRFEWLLGVFATRTAQDVRSALTEIAPGSAALYREHRHDRLAEVAVYGEASLALTSRLTLSAGIRAFRSDLHTASTAEQLGVGLRSFEDETHTADVAPKLVLAYQAMRSTLVYLQASQGYRVGGFNTSGPIGQVFSEPGGPQPTRRFLPDELWNVELGVKGQLLRGRLQFRAAAYAAVWSDIQSDQFLPSGLPFTANVGRGANRGLEVETTYRLHRDLTLKAVLLADDPELTRRDPTYPSRNNASLPGVPEISGALAIDYRRPLASGWTASLYAQAAYVGSSHLTFDATPTNPMGNYVTGRVSAGVERGAWRLLAFVDNPANALGDTFAFGDPFSVGRMRQVTPIRPRTVGLSVSAGF